MPTHDPSRRTQASGSLAHNYHAAPNLDTRRFPNNRNGENFWQTKEMDDIRIEMRKYMASHSKTYRFDHHFTVQLFICDRVD